MSEPALRIHLDLIGGLAGDMFVAGMLDAFPTQREPLLAVLRLPTLAAPVDVRIDAHRGGSFVGTRFIVDTAGAEVAQAHSLSHAHEGPMQERQLHEGHGHEALRHEGAAQEGHTHEGHADERHMHRRHAHGGPTSGAPAPEMAGYHRHGHVAHAAIVERLAAAPLAPAVRVHALAIFRLLAEAEAAVHGVAVDRVEFHEVGAWDSIIDIVAAAFLIDAVGPARWSHGAIPIGGGVIGTAHGVMPVPAPATLHLLLGAVVIDDGVPGERVTPTGAAILRYLDERFGVESRARRPERVIATGFGFGSRKLADRPNAVRCTAYEATPATNAQFEDVCADDWVDTLEFDVDDQTGEDLAIALDALRGHADVLQVGQLALVGKKGRLATRVHVVVRAGAAAAVARACFEQTTTIGLRWQQMPRFVLKRRGVRIDAAADVNLGVKLSERAGALTAKVEADDLARVGGGHAGRERARRDTEARALALAGNGQHVADAATPSTEPANEYRAAR